MVIGCESSLIEGYYAIEAPPHLFPQELQTQLKDLLKQYDFKFIYQIHTDSYMESRRKDVQVT